MLSSRTLDGNWGFIIDPSNRGLTWGRYHEETPTAFAGDLHRGYKDLLMESVPVPGSWQMYAEQYRWYDGTAFFFRKFSAPKLKEGQRAFLHFEGISFRAQAWLNGAPIGSMEFPYLPWEMEITDHLKKSNLLVVRVEGISRPDDTIPIFGWRNFAGILRSVHLHVTGPSRLGTVLLDPTIDLQQGSGRFAARYEIDSKIPAKNLHVRWKLSGRGLRLEGRAPLSKAADGWHRFETPPRKVNFWSPETPALYQFELELLDSRENVLDRYRCKTGFRRFETRPGEGFFLNGKPVWPRGISRHNLHDEFGMTLNCQWLKTDMDLVQELNCNALRIAHMPNDDAVLGECDLRGLLVWAEIPVYWNAALERPQVRQKMLGQFEAMLRRDYNHPSVVMWSPANEIASETPAGLRALRAARKLIRRFDPHRPMTFASWPRQPEKNLGLKCIDFCSMNLYRGWYQSRTAQLNDDLQAIRKHAPHLPIVLSEFGAGAVAGMRGSKHKPWTEDFQTRVIRDNLETIRRLGDGSFLWLLNDFLDPSRVHSRITSGFMNNKGLVSADRKQRKLAFGEVRRIYGKWKEEDRKQTSEAGKS